ncbi:MAG: hypothetical protein ACPGVA_12425 [Pikeienuella sp.]
MRKLHLNLAIYAFIIAAGAVTIWQTSDLPESLPGDLGSVFLTCGWRLASASLPI